MPKKTDKPQEKFITVFSRSGGDNGEATVKTHDTLPEALKELKGWIPEADSAKEDGEEPEFRLFKGVELHLEVEQVVTTTVNLRKIDQ